MQKFVTDNIELKGSLGFPLTREYIATHINLSDTQLPIDKVEELIGRKVDVNNIHDILQASIEIQAIMRVYMADALIEQLVKTQKYERTT